MENSQGEKILANAPWIDANWMWISLVLGGATLLHLMKNREAILHKRGPQIWYGLLLCAIYSVHQLEEHGYDVFGRRYMFVPLFNANLGTQLGVAVTPRQTTYINLIAIWITIPVCAYLSNAGNKYIPIAVSWGMAVFNGAFGHLYPLLEGKYMPATRLHLFI